MRSRPKIAIIGAGASGLMAGITASKGAKITIFEQNSSPAKKLLATGNGRCNITNKNLSANDYISAVLQTSKNRKKDALDSYTKSQCKAKSHKTNTPCYEYEKSDFALEVLSQFGFCEFEEFCELIALPLDVKSDGRCYPLTNEAKSVWLALLDTAQSSGVEILCDTKIGAIEKNHDGWILKSDEKCFQVYDCVILATGSNAAPQLGGGDTGYAIAKAFGHEIVPLFPALVQLCLDSSLAPKFSGIKCDGVVKLFVNDKLTDEARGDLLFTNYGISGFAILDISSSASSALLARKKVEIELDILPRLSIHAVKNLTQKVAHKAPRRTLFSILSSFVSPKIVAQLLKSKNLSLEMTLGDCDVLDEILTELKAWKFRVSNTHGFKHAEVSGGGVSVSEINPKSMESKLTRDLYIIGEMLDVTGRRGGYNLAFAWASGVVAARACLNAFYENR